LATDISNWNYEQAGPISEPWNPAKYEVYPPGDSNPRVGAVVDFVRCAMYAACPGSIREEMMPLQLAWRAASFSDAKVV
jgi:hypothetical protein